MLDLKEIEKEVDLDRVRKFYHNLYPSLSGYNYTESCQFSKLWNPTNLSCRGLIFDGENCIARPFSKFFNIEELIEDLSKKSIKFIQNKEDGSLIISYFYDNKVNFATRGSFHSDQSVIAERIWSKKYFNKIDNALFKDWTLLFELVGPSNVNVSRGYANDDLILLSAISIKTGEESSQDFVAQVAETLGCPRPVFFQANSTEHLYQKIKENNDPNFEGVVVTFSDGLKVKIKSNLYINLHKVISGSLSRATRLELWDELKSTSKISIVDKFKIPDEFFSEIKIEINKINILYDSLLEKYNPIYIQMKSDFENEMSRKDMALKWTDYRWLLSPIFSNEKNIEPYFLRIFKKNYLDGSYE